MNEKQLKFDYLATNELIPYARNARKHSEQQITKIASSIREFGFLAPIIIDDNHTIIAGHGRVLAAQKLGLDKVPCVKASHLSDTQRRAYTLADNKIALLSEWDDDLLKIEIDELKLESFDLEVTGFDTSFLDSISNPVHKPIEGSKELNEDDFSDFDNKCPRCGFEFNVKE